MAAPVEKPKKEEVLLELSFDHQVFAQHITYNWFSIEKVESGCVVHLAWIARNVAVEIVSILISREGLQQLKATSTKYIQTFTTAPTAASEFPSAKLNPPKFSNLLRLSRAGMWSEIGFYLISLADIATAAKGANGNKKIEPIGVAIAHGENSVHEQLVLTLLASI